METNYISYLPPVLSNVREFKALDQSVDAYFNDNLWPDVNQQFANQFITTSYEDGISYYESLCGLTPGANDSLSSRRGMVLAKWSSQLPYNYDALVKRLDAICGAGEYELFPYFGEATIGLFTHSVKNIKAVENLLREIIPCHIKMDISNEISEEINQSGHFAGAVIRTKHIHLTTGGDSAAV